MTKIIDALNRIDEVATHWAELDKSEAELLEKDYNLVFDYITKKSINKAQAKKALYVLEVIAEEAGLYGNDKDNATNSIKALSDFIKKAK